MSIAALKTPRMRMSVSLSNNIGNSAIAEDYLANMAVGNAFIP